MNPFIMLACTQDGHEPIIMTTHHEVHDGLWDLVQQSLPDDAKVGVHQFPDDLHLHLLSF